MAHYGRRCKFSQHVHQTCQCYNLSHLLNKNNTIYAKSLIAFNAVEIYENNL